MLMLAETFAEQPAGPVADHRVADAFAGDDAELRRRAVRQAMPVGDEAAQRQAFALLPDPREIAVLTRVANRGPVAGVGRRATGDWRLGTGRA